MTRRRFKIEIWKWYPKFGFQDWREEATVEILSSSSFYLVMRVPSHFVVHLVHLIRMRAYGGVIVVVVIESVGA